MTVDTTSAPVHARATVRPDKADVVAALAEAFRTSTAAVLTEYRGLTVKQVTALRVALGADTTYAVVKNTLTRLAASDAGLEGLDDLLAGPTAVAFVKGGVLDGKPLSADEVRRLADLESREVLLAKMAGALLASLSGAVYLLNAPLAQVARLAGALQAKAEEDPSVIGGAGTPAPAAESLAVDPAADTAADTSVGAVDTSVETAADTAADTAAPTAEVDGPTADTAADVVETAPAAGETA